MMIIKANPINDCGFVSNHHGGSFSPNDWKSVQDSEFPYAQRLVELELRGHTIQATRAPISAERGGALPAFPKLR